MSTEHEGAKGKEMFTSSANWDASAKAYVKKMMGGSMGKIRLEMFVGRKLVVDRVVSALESKESPVVLDVAAAGGEPTLTMAKAMPHAEVHGTDFAPAMVEFIRKRAEESGLSNVKAGVEDGMLLSGVGDGTVDAVTCTWGIESMPDHMKALQQFHRVLRADGLAVITAWDKNPNSLATKVLGVMQEISGSHPVGNISPLGGEEGNVARKLMEEAGFVDVQVSKVNIPMYASPGTGYGELFASYTGTIPTEVALASMESAGRPNIREEAAAIFEAKMEKDMAEGNGPPGPGLPSGGRPPHDESQPIFFLEALLIEGLKKE